MSEKKSPIKSITIRALFFLICVSMFLYGSLHYMDHMPYTVKKPIIKIKRFLKARQNRALVTDDSISLERRSQALRKLELLNTDDLQEICEKIVTSASRQLKKQAQECVLRVGTESAIEKVFLSLDDKDPLALSFQRAVDLISSNPQGRDVLKKLLEKRDIGETLRLSILGTLAQNNKTFQDQLQQMFDKAETEEQRYQIIQTLTLASPDNPVVVNFHHQAVRNPEANIETSLVFLAHRGDPWLRENFLKLYQQFGFKEQKQLLDLTPYLCPNLQVKQWKSEFLKTNSFAIKQRLFSALLLYRLKDRSETIKRWLADPKLRPKEVDLLKKKASQYSRSEKQVCR